MQTAAQADTSSDLPDSDQGSLPPKPEGHTPTIFLALADHVSVERSPNGHLAVILYLFSTAGAAGVDPQTDTLPGGLFIALSPKCLTCDNGCDKPAMNKPPGTESRKYVGWQKRAGKPWRHAQPFDIRHDSLFRRIPYES